MRLTTCRYVDHRHQRVEYRGMIKRDGSITWEGAAETTNGSPQSTWAFTATRR